MSVILLPEFAAVTDDMYSAFIRQAHYQSASSPRGSPQVNRRCVAKNSHSPSPSRDRGRDNSPRVRTPKPNTARVNSSQNLCHLCHDQQSSLITSVAKLSLCDKHTAPADDGPRVVKHTGPADDGPRTVQAMLSATTALTTPQLAESLEAQSPPVILDCRSFIAYNLCHVRGAINVGCADRVTKRRLQSGKICVVDLIKCSQALEQFRANPDSEIVIYDDDSTEITEGSCGANTSLHLILKSLLLNDKKVHFLKGGLAEFHARFEHLCNQSKPPPCAPLYSPTTPIISNEIDTATASRILPFLFIGNERDASNRERLRELGITHVLNVTSHIPFYFEDDLISYKRLQASDSGSQNLKQYFMEASGFIDEVRRSGGKVLVHCQAGVSRSATITVAYVLIHSRMSMMDAFKFVKSNRSIIAPNFNFMGQLMELEKGLNDGTTERDLSVDIGVQSAV